MSWGAFERLQILQKKLSSLLPLANQKLEALYAASPFSFDDLFSQYLELGSKLAPYLTCVETAINDALEAKKTVLFEGANGSLLDVTFGTYPFVTSSHTLAGGL